MLPTTLRTWHCAALLFIAVFSAYLNTLRHGLVGFDDAVLLEPGAGAPVGVSAPAFWARRAASNPLAALPEFFLKRQLRNISLAADRSLFGDDLWGPHLNNILHHFAVSCLVFLIGSRLLRSRLGGLAAALLFALHPIQTESVSYLGGRRDLLCALLSLSSFHLFALGWDRPRGEASSPRRSFKKPFLPAAAVFFWLLAMSAKQAAVALPALWAAYAWLLAPKGGLRRVGGAAFWLACALACAAVFGLHWAQSAGAKSRLALPEESLWYGGSALAHWATEPRILLHALALLVYPSVLSGDYSLSVFRPAVSLLDAGSCAAAAVLAVLAGAAWVLRVRRPAAAFGAAWIAISYAPMLPVLPTVHNLEVFAEHWLYLPVFGAALMGADAFLRLRARRPKAAAALLLAVLACFLIRTLLRNRDWKDDETFWSKTALTYPRCARALAARGLALFNRGRIEEAEALYRRSLDIVPGHPRIRINLAFLHSAGGRPRQAEDELLGVLRSPWGRAFLGPIRHNLGVLYLQSGRAMEAYRSFMAAQNAGMGIASQHGVIYAWEALKPPARLRYQALEMHRRILEREPGYAPALNDLGLLLIGEGRFKEALPLLDKAVARSPRFVNARINLALALTGAGRYPEALTQTREALRLDPGSGEAWIALSALQRRWGMPSRAEGSARRAVRLSGSRRAYRELLEARQAALFGRIRRPRQ